MAALDNVTTPFKFNVGTFTIAGSGSGESLSITGALTFSWTRTGRAYQEARNQGRHQSTPVVVETEDGNISLTISGYVTSFLGSSNVHPYEAITHDGNAASWASQSTGGKKTVSITAAPTSAADGGGAQSIVFNHCANDSCDIDFQGEGSLFTFSATFTDLENDPTIT